VYGIILYAANLAKQEVQKEWQGGVMARKFKEKKRKKKEEKKIDRAIRKFLVKKTKKK